MSIQMKAGNGQNQERTVQSHIQCSGSTLLHQCKCEWVFGFIHMPAVSSTFRLPAPLSSTTCTVFQVKHTPTQPHVIENKKKIDDDITEKERLYPL